MNESGTSAPGCHFCGMPSKVFTSLHIFGILKLLDANITGTVVLIQLMPCLQGPLPVCSVMWLSNSGFLFLFPALSARASGVGS